MFEVQDLRFATLATVSRCGMIWFSEDVLSTEMIFENFLLQLRHIPLEEVEEEISYKKKKEDTLKEDLLSPTLQVLCSLIQSLSFRIKIFLPAFSLLKNKTHVSIKKKKSWIYI